MQKRVISVLIIFASLIILSGFISATCSIKTNCSVGETKVMGLSSATNAHGQLANQSGYTYSLCCTGTGSATCDVINPLTGQPRNKIIGLSSPTNAHAEGPGGISYANNVCFGSFQCVSANSTCPASYATPILSLSSSTNAHIGNATAYSTLICCSGASNFIGASCDLTDAAWQVPTITKGLPATMTVAGTAGCIQQGTGALIKFSIYKGSTLITTVLGNYPSARWPALQGTDYYFIAEVNQSGDSFSGLNGTGYDKLSVLASTNPNLCGSMVTCESYTNFGTSSDSQIACSSDYCTLASSDPRVDSTPSTGYTFGCGWNNITNTCNFTENYGLASATSVLCGNGQTLCYNPTSDLKYCYVGYTCPSGHQILADGNAVCNLGEGCSSVECTDNSQDSCIAGTKCKKGTSTSEGICYSTGPKVNETSCPSKYSLCYNTAENLQYCYPEGVCPSGSVPPAGSCASTSPDSSETCVGTNAVCSSGVCSDSSVSVGKCTYSYVNTGDTCDDDGFLTYEWTASWSGSGSRPANCAATGQATIECPAQIPLPLFTPVNAVITVIAIIGIYAIIILVRKSHKGKKHHKRKH